MDLGVAGRTALVTGADFDDGRACAALLAAEGADVVTDAAEAPHTDIVVLSTTRHPGSRLDLMSAEELLQVWDPVADAVAVYKAALAGMVARRWGRIVWIGSAAARSLDADDDELGAVTSLGMRGLHKVISAEAGASNVTANAVLRAREAAPDDVAAAVTFLCSTWAGYLTGVTITVDGAVGAAMF